MKRMSEVLNIRVVKNAFYDASNDSWICAFVDEDKAQHAAHAIDHIDALADALESAIDFIGGTAWVRFKSENPELAEEENSSELFKSSKHYKSVASVICDLQDALAAYRGGK